MDISWFKSRRESGMSNSTVDSGYAGSVGSTNGNGSHDSHHGIVQMCGIMQKKPFGHQSTKWSRRFFILKEGYLLYYAESEKKVFETKKCFNIHPKGVIPLGYCTIEDVSLPGMPYCISIGHPELKINVCVAADDEENRKAWIKAMDKATKVTIENTGLSETMIKSLQEQSLQLARERQEYVDKFISEAEELGAERELREALEEFNQELEEENARIEGLVEELKEAHNEVKSELQQAIESSRQLEKQREEMRRKTDELQENLEELSNEKSTIIRKLQDHEARAKMPAEKNAELARHLAAIEEKALVLERDREAIRLKLEENQRMSKDLLREREAISHEAEELKIEMQNLSVEKKLAEEELKEEVVARMELQRELEECKAALKRLEAKALNRTSENKPEERKETANGVRHAIKHDADDTNAQIMRDVKSLREFFETCARENKMEESNIQPSRRRRQSVTARRRPESTGTMQQTAHQEESTSPSRPYARASLIRRRGQSARCKSMVLGDDFTIATVMRDPISRRTLLLSRHQRSTSFSEKRKMTLPRKSES